MINMNDIHWVAGFLEGEGSFYTGKPPFRRGQNTAVTANQTQKWPLEKLNSIIPGKMCLINKKAPHTSVWQWYTNVPTSAGLMMMIYPLMSPKRKKQIECALFFWKIRLTNRWEYRTHCIHGHEINEINTYIYKGSKSCKICHKEIALAHYIKLHPNYQKRY